MADKKKKLYPAKDPIIPRRPVILKSEREPAKDHQKEKLEKERPTIILKTREQSTPKDDRPQSPKHTTEVEILQPCKIAQKENKEKKIIVERPSPPLKLMSKPVKLLDENMEFNTAALEFMNDSSTNYLVVGIIGTQSVGKSMILNLIAQNKPLDGICQRILSSHALPLEQKSDESNLNAVQEFCEFFENTLNFVGQPEAKQQGNDFKFKMQNIDHIERGLHCTKGIDMYVTEDRVILLDCQPLWSPSLIDEASNASPVTSRSANVAVVDCLQLASYLMAVCHVLIAAQDWAADYNFIRYIQTAEMLKPTLSASNTPLPLQEGSESSHGGESHPHLLLLHNRCQLEDFTPDAVRILQDLYRKAFQKSSLQLNSGMYLYSDSNKNGLNIDNVCKGYNLDSCGTPLNLFLLPEIDEDYENRDIYRGHPPFEMLADRLRAMVLGVNRHQLSNVPNLSEKGWFQYCSKAWETIRKCNFFMEYERFLP